MKPIRLGVIGCGVIGSRHVEFAKCSPLLEMRAVADTSEDRAQQIAEKFDIPLWLSSTEALIGQDDVEAVVLALPTGVRMPIARQVLASGKHLLVEKPVAMNSDEVRELLAIRGKSIVACCSSRQRWLPSAQVVSQCIADGTLGSIRMIRGRAIRAARQAPTGAPPPWRQSKALNGGGILVNWGCYDLDYLLGVTGWRLVPEVVFAQTWPIAFHLSARVAPDSDADSHFISLIRCQGGAVISLERAEFAAVEDEDAFHFIGDKASLRTRMAAERGKVVTLDETEGEQGVTSREIWRGDEEGGSATQNVLEDFAHAIREGSRPATDLERSLVIQEITDAIYTSAETGSEVRITGLPSNL